MTNLNEKLRAEIREAYTEHTGNSAIDYDGREWLDFEGGYLQCLRRAPAAAPAPADLIEVRCPDCDITDTKHECETCDSTGFVEQARAAAPAPVAASVKLLAEDDINEAAVEYYVPMTDSIHDVVGFARSIERLVIAALAAAPPAPAAAPIVQPVLWIDASAAPYEDQGSLYPESNRQVALLGCTEGPFGNYTTPLYAAPTPASSTADAKDAAPEQRVDQLNAALERAARELPEGYAIRVEVEHGAGWVQWFDAEGNEFDIDRDDNGLAENVERAINDAFDRAAITSSAGEVKR
jgi:hypothetical protein